MSPVINVLTGISQLSCNENTIFACPVSFVTTKASFQICCMPKSMVSFCVERVTSSFCCERKRCLHTGYPFNSSKKSHAENLQAHINDGDWEFQQGGWSHYLIF